MNMHQHSDILDLYLLYVCCPTPAVCEVKVTPGLCLKPYERGKQGNARKSTKEVYLNQLLRFELIGELLRQGRPILTFLYQRFHDISASCITHYLNHRGSTAESARALQTRAGKSEKHYRFWLRLKRNMQFGA